jgi:predicted ATPase
MLIIGAYRSNEVSSSHPLQLAINELTKANSVPISNIELRPLPFNIVKQWIVDLLNNISSASSRDVAPLAEIIFKKTEGNPFFVKVFMQVKIPTIINK